MKRYKRVAEAVLERTIIDLLKPIAENRKKTADWTSAYQWVFNPDNGSILRFELCCEVLDVNPDQLREKLREACSSRINALRVLCKSRKMDINDISDIDGLEELLQEDKETSVDFIVDSLRRGSVAPQE